MSMVFLPCSDWKTVLACSSRTRASGSTAGAEGLVTEEQSTFKCPSLPANGQLPSQGHWRSVGMCALLRACGGAGGVAQSTVSGPSDSKTLVCPSEMPRGCPQLLHGSGGRLKENPAPPLTFEHGQRALAEVGHRRGFPQCPDTKFPVFNTAQAAALPPETRPQRPQAPPALDQAPM